MQELLQADLRIKHCVLFAEYSSAIMKGLKSYSKSHEGSKALCFAEPWWDTNMRGWNACFLA
jgi:hypothetical protein